MQEHTKSSVDDGKSTLLGRLIYETDNLLVDQSEYLSKLNQKFSKKDIDIDYSLLLDGLIDEKEQGITIDIAFKYFVLGNTQFTLIDSPGHSSGPALASNRHQLNPIPAEHLWAE